MAVIDADAHVLETNRTWEYMEGAEKAYRPQIVTSSNDAGVTGEYWLVDGRLHAKSDNVGHDTPEESREMSDIASRLKHMDEMGVSMQVLYPTIFLRPVTDKPEVEMALFKSYNRWLCDIWKAGHDRLRWAANTAPAEHGRVAEGAGLRAAARRLRRLRPRPHRRPPYQRPLLHPRSTRP